MHSKRIHLKIPKDANHLELHVCALNGYISAKTASHIPTLSGHCSSHQHWWKFNTVATSWITSIKNSNTLWGGRNL